MKQQASASKPSLNGHLPLHDNDDAREGQERSPRATTRRHRRTEDRRTCPQRARTHGVSWLDPSTKRQANRQTAQGQGLPRKKRGLDSVAGGRARAASAPGSDATSAHGQSPTGRTRVSTIRPGTRCNVRLGAGIRRSGRLGCRRAAKERRAAAGPAGGTRARGGLLRARVSLGDDRSSAAAAGFNDRVGGRAFACSRSAVADPYDRPPGLPECDGAGACGCA